MKGSIAGYKTGLNAPSFVGVFHFGKWTFWTRRL